MVWRLSSSRTRIAATADPSAAVGVLHVESKPLGLAGHKHAAVISVALMNRLADTIHRFAMIDALRFPAGFVAQSFNVRLNKWY